MKKHCQLTASNDWFSNAASTLDRLLEVLELLSAGEYTGARALLEQESQERKRRVIKLARKLRKTAEHGVTRTCGTRKRGEGSRER